MTKKTGPAGTVVPLKKSKCPNCAKLASAKYLPFCSDRCANLDLGRWLDGEYRIPTDEGPDAFADGDEDA
ncbi:MAG: DNA gyrase inhibitor YacG [Rhodospirillales bacterium]|nr:DNA gyrase inhibitor YacG [Rhodospirillales bacterium]